MNPGAERAVAFMCWFGLFQSEVLPNVPREDVVNLCVSWYGLLLAGLGIHIHIVTGTKPKHDAPIPEKLTDEFFPLHTAMAFS